MTLVMGMNGEYASLAIAIESQDGCLADEKEVDSVLTRKIHILFVFQRILAGNL